MPHRKRKMAKRLSTTRRKTLRILPKKSQKLPIQFSIHVPSTRTDRRGRQRSISSTRFRNRITGTRRFLGRTFGGDTTVRGRGGYVTKRGRLISERIGVVEASTTRAQYLRNKSKLRAYIRQKRKDWKQESIGYNIEDDFYIFPK